MVFLVDSYFVRSEYCVAFGNSYEAIYIQALIEPWVTISWLIGRGPQMYALLELWIVKIIFNPSAPDPSWCKNILVEAIVIIPRIQIGVITTMLFPFNNLITLF